MPRVLSSSRHGGTFTADAVDEQGDGGTRIGDELILRRQRHTMAGNNDHDHIMTRSVVENHQGELAPLARLEIL